MLYRSIKCRTRRDEVEVDAPLSPSVLLSSPKCRSGAVRQSSDIAATTSSDSVLSVCVT